ncbi:unnamed protein product [Clonostachys rhizophaga]|uniref:Uncharacterized protein n=1 Tax=Clonostachys rhizophaga TaxID=160324 RepID=A0A9N9V5G3_9HYPO|nr:unnamed protein product [Clonostachys rhizophaga]
MIGSEPKNFHMDAAKQAGGGLYPVQWTANCGSTFKLRGDGGWAISSRVFYQGSDTAKEILAFHGGLQARCTCLPSKAGSPRKYLLPAHSALDWLATYKLAP